jgi:hypothetical protein
MAIPDIVVCQIKSPSKKHESYALTKLTEPPENGFVSFVSSHTERLGEFFHYLMAKNDSRKNDDTPKFTPNKLTKPYPDAFHGIEPMTEC